jgi:hypothetical protein
LVAAFGKEPPTRYAATNAQFGWPIDLGESTLKAELVRKELGRIVAGCVVVGVMASCSQRTSEGVANTAPIPSEPIVSTRPPAPQPTQPATTTTLPGSPLQASDIPPVPILVRYQPQNKDEEELLVAAQDLLPKLYALNHDARFVQAEYSRVLTADASKVWLTERRKFRTDGRDSVPGVEDRIVIESVARVSPDSGTLNTCEFDTSVTYKRPRNGERTVDNDEVASIRYEATVVRTIDGWRIAGTRDTETFPGENRCAS